MAFPAILYAYLESGIQVKITGAARETRKPVITWDKEKYRDSPPVVVGGASAALGASASASIAGGINPSASVLAGISAEASGGSSTEQDDSLTHVPKRNVPKLDEMVEYWDSEIVGDAMTGLSVTTVSGSGVITVPDAQLLTPGQAIAGAGIPVGTTILDILSEAAGVITKTTAVMSQQATATATVAATLTGGNRVGKYKESEFLGWGEEISTPL